MADAAPLFKKKKGNRAALRVRSADSDAPEAPEEERPAIEVVNRHAKKTTKNKSSMSFLSFGEPSAPLKKSGGGLTLAASTANQADLVREEAPASVYSKGYLEELKSLTISKKPSLAALEHAELDAGAMPDRLIPSDQAITEAKRKRERLRAQGGQIMSDEQDFISLDVAKPSKSGHESRLVREGDEGDEDLAEYTGLQDRVPLGKKATKLAAKKNKQDMMQLIDDAEDDALDDDEEMKLWESAQIHRGEAYPLHKQDDSRTGKSDAYRPAKIPRQTPLPTLDAVAEKYSHELKAMQAAVELDTAAVDRLGTEKVQLAEHEAELRNEVARVEMKNRWTADFRDLIETVAVFLEEKFPLLEAIQDENAAIQKQRYQLVFARRFADDSDDVALFTGQAVPSIYHDPLRIVSDSEAASHVTEGPKAESRLRRREQREERGFSDIDDELSREDSQQMKHAFTHMGSRLAALFDDVKSADFRDINLGVRAKFEEWWQQYRDDYNNAYGTLALVGVWEFWARVEMALWNPFEIPQLAKTPPVLDSYRWFQSLDAYTQNLLGDNDQLKEEDNAISFMISTVIVPCLETFAKCAYDPLSKNHTSKALALVDEVSFSIDVSGSRFQSLVLVFLNRIQDYILQIQTLVLPHLKYVSIPSLAFDSSCFTARNRFLHRQLKLVENALRWRQFTKGVILHFSSIEEDLATSINTVSCSFEELLTRELIGRILLPIIEAGWSTGGNEVAQKILDIVPPDMLVPALQQRLRGGNVSM